MTGVADARIFHKKGSHGERIIGLDHLAFRVWHQYVLSADDYGVMRESASVLRADNPKLEAEPFRRVERALADVVASKLVQRFTHQGVSYLWQLDWQDFQQIRYPRDTVLPSPPPEELANATVLTQKLFALRAKPSRERLRNVSETAPIPAGAGGRQTLTQTQTPPDDLSDSEESLRETTNHGGTYRPVNPHAKPTNLVNGAELRRHGSHAWCSWPGRDGLCVPVFLHQKFAGKLGGADAGARLIAWYPTVVARFEGVAVAEDDVKFWQREFSAWVAGSGSDAALERVLSGRGELR